MNNPGQAIQIIVNPFTVNENLFLYYSCLCLEWRGVLGRVRGKMCMHLHVFIDTRWPLSNRKIYVLLEARRMENNRAYR